MEPAEIDRIVREVKDGDIERYGELVEAFQQQIYKYCFHMMGQVQEAEDIAQDVLVKGYERLAHYREGTSFSAWLYTIAYRECLNKLKRARTYGLLLRLISRSTPVAWTDRTTAGPVYNEALREALLRLSPKDRHIIVLRIAEDYRFEDIAKQLDMSYAAVRKRYERAKKQLKQWIVQKEENEDERSYSF